MLPTRPTVVVLFEQTAMRNSVGAILSGGVPLTGFAQIHQTRRTSGSPKQFRRREPHPEIARRGYALQGRESSRPSGGNNALALADSGKLTGPQGVRGTANTQRTDPLRVQTVVDCGMAGRTKRLER